MLTSATPHALVMTLHVANYNQVLMARFEVEQRFMPVCVDKSRTYSIETHRAGFSVRDVMRSSYVDVATWLHRSGLWDSMPPET